MDYGHGGIKMDRKKLNVLTRMGKEIGYILSGVKMDKKNLNIFTKMGMKMD